MGQARLCLDSFLTPDDHHVGDGSKPWLYVRKLICFPVTDNGISDNRSSRRY
jgi:hypothetical protein